MGFNKEAATVHCAREIAVATLVNVHVRFQIALYVHGTHQDRARQLEINYHG